MTAIKSVVRLSLLEFLHEKIVWIFIFFCRCSLWIESDFGSAFVRGTAANHRRILVGWPFSLPGLVLFFSLGSGWLHKELDRQTCLLVLARPVSRTQFFLGKFLGIWIFVFRPPVLMSLLLFVLLQAKVPAADCSPNFLGYIL